MGRTCEVKHCWNTSIKNSKVSFFKFPDDKNNCWLWVQYCQSPELERLFLNSGSGALRYKKICSDHFSTESLRDPGRSDKGLRVGSMPVLAESNHSKSEKQPQQSNSSDRRKMTDDCRCTSFCEECLIMDGEHYCNVEYLEEDIPDYIQDTTDEIYEKVIDNEGSYSNFLEGSRELEPLESSKVTMLQMQLVVTSEKNADLKIQIKRLKELLRLSERKCKRKDSALKSLKIVNQNLNEQLKHLRTNNQKGNSVLKALHQNQTVYNSLENSTKKAKGRRYGPALKKFALSSYLSGPRVYRMINRSKTLTLPTKRTIQRWTKEVRIGPGLNAGVLQNLKLKVNNFSEKERVALIAIDGMKIKAALSYSAKSDTFHGFPDTGDKRKFAKNDPMHLATEAVTVMVRGVFSKFKQGLGYFLTHNTLGSESQLEIIEKTIRCVREVGLNPILLVMDQFATNIKMAKETGTTSNKPYFLVDKKPVYVMWDSPHLLKNARNMMKKFNPVFNNQLASFSDIEKLFEIDSLANPRLAPRLTERHITLPPFSPMNVSLAARTLSQSVSAALQYYALSEELPARVTQTAEFISIHDKLFDTLNSRQLTCSAKPFKGALQEHSCHWQFLEETKKMLSEMYYTNKLCFDVSKAHEESKSLTVKQRHPNYITGFINNINAVQMLWKDLREQFDCQYLCTIYLSQDCLENLFSEIRRRCGSNDTPDALQFGAAFKYAAIESNTLQTGGENCESDNIPPLLSEFGNDESQSNTNQEFSYKHVPLDTKTPLEIPVKELNALNYILGAAARKLFHGKCIKKLTAETQESLLDDEMYNFCKIKQAISGHNHMLPNNKLYAIGILCYGAFKQKFRKFLHDNQRGVKTRLKKIITYDLFDNVICERCFKLLIDKIFNTLINGFLKQVKIAHTQRNSKKLKRNGKARRMCLPQNPNAIETVK